jgi:hypothetical protein
MRSALEARRRRKRHSMENSEKDRLATAVVDRWCSFQEALAKRRYRLQDFVSFADAARRYIAEARIMQ